MKSDKIKQGFDPRYFMSMCAAAGLDGNWTGIKNACGIGVPQTVNRRRNEPLTFRLDEMQSAVKRCNMSNYDIIRVWFNDRLDTLDEKVFYADLFRKMSDWLNGSQSDTTQILDAIKELNAKLDRLEAEIQAMKKGAE